MKRFVVVLVLMGMMVLHGAFAGSAQENEPGDGCPKDHVCVLYTNADGERDQFALELDEGIYQEIVVEERTTTVRLLGGVTIREPVTIKLASFLINEEGTAADLIRERVVEQEGIYEDAELGDSFGVAELS